MAVVYGVIWLAFAPLFILFMLLLKRNFAGMYDRMKVNLSFFFVVFMIVMGFRLFIYYLISFSPSAWANVETIRGEIPLYVSEIFLSLCYMTIMSRQYHNNLQQD